MRLTFYKGLWITFAACTLLAIVVQSALIQKQDFKILRQFFGPVFCFQVMAWLWAMVIDNFETSLIKYEACFHSDDHQFLLKAAYIYRILATFSTVFLIFAVLFTTLSLCGLSEVATVLIPLMYLSQLMILVNPINCLYRDTRRYVAVSLMHVLIPIQKMNFSEFILGDIITSLVIPIGELAKANCIMFAGIQSTFFHQPREDICQSNSVYQFIVQCYPYAIRLVQCLTIYFTIGDFNQLLNAVKYATNFPVVGLLLLRTYLYDQGDMNSYHAITYAYLVSAFISTLYLVYWDVEKDWDMKLIRQEFFKRLDLGIKKERFYSNKGFYYTVILINFVLRFKWLIYINMTWKKHWVTLLLMALTEIYRRYLWVFIRIETELRKIQNRSGNLLLEDQLSMPRQSHFSLLPWVPVTSTQQPSTPERETLQQLRYNIDTEQLI